MKWTRYEEPVRERVHLLERDARDTVIMDFRDTSGKLSCQEVYGDPNGEHILYAPSAPRLTKVCKISKPTAHA